MLKPKRENPKWEKFGSTWASILKKEEEKKKKKECPQIPYVSQIWMNRSFPQSINSDACKKNFALMKVSFQS